MFLVESDPARGIAVVVIGPPASDADWVAYADTLETLNKQVPKHTRPLLMQLIRSGTAFPTPLTRQRLGRLRAEVRADTINVVVSGSQTIRGVQIALDWIRKPHYDSSSHPTAEAALRHAEGLMGRPLPEFRALYARVARKLEAA